MPSFRTTLLASAGAGAALTGIAAGARYAELDEWADGIAALDRQALFNRQPLPAIDRPADPQYSGVRNNLWWKIALPIAIIPPILIGLTLGIITTFASEFPAQGLIAAFMGTIVAAVVCVPIALGVAVISALWRNGQIKGHKIAYDIQAQKVAIWEYREESRHQLAAGIKPVEYLEAIGIEPQSFQL